MQAMCSDYQIVFLFLGLVLFLFVLGLTPGSVLLIELRRLYVIKGIKAGWAVCKARALPAVLFLLPHIFLSLILINILENIIGVHVQWNIYNLYIYYYDSLWNLLGMGLVCNFKIVFLKRYCLILGKYIFILFLKEAIVWTNKEDKTKLNLRNLSVNLPLSGICCFSGNSI